MDKRKFFCVYAILFFTVILFMISYNAEQKPLIEIEFSATNYGEPLILYYDNNEETIFDDEHIKQDTIVENNKFQDVVFQIPKNSLDNLRIDIGTSSGNAIIKKIEIKKNLFM